MRISTPARLALRGVALLYLTVLLAVPIVTIAWRTFEPGLGAFWDSIRTPAAISAFRFRLKSCRTFKNILSRSADC